MFHTSSRPSLRFVGSSSMRQHPLKAKIGAIFADACELSPTMLGICDGVSEVQSFGINPAHLPEELLLKCKELLETSELSEDSTEPHRQIDNEQWLRDLLEEAYFQTSSQGSTTILLAAIEDGRQLVTLNVGDSGLLLIRSDGDGRHNVIYRTKPLRYDQFRPYQVGRFKGVSNAQIRGIIQQGLVERVSIQHGDILILGSDGLFDNLFEEDMIDEVRSHCSQPDGISSCADPNIKSPSVKQLTKCADALVQSALQAVSIGQIGQTGAIEFSDTAKVAPSGHGGKADDTSCIVVTVVNRSASTTFQSGPVEKNRWLQNLFCTPKCNEDTIKTKMKSSVIKQGFFKSSMRSSSMSH